MGNMKEKACNMVIVSRGRSFIIDSIMARLGENGVTCTLAQPSVRELEKCRDEADMLLLYDDNDIADMADILVYVKDICADDARALYLAGSMGALSKMKKMIPGELIRREFTRPIDVNKTVTAIVSDAQCIVRNENQKSILVVDDDVSFLKMVRKWLMDRYKVTIVKSGLQGIQFMAGHRPDLILMDYDMPVTTGSKVLEMLRSEPELRDVPVIFLTGKADRETVMQVMSLRPQGYLLKSMSREEILSAIGKYFETAKWQNAASMTETGK